jgi:hypothetical protein
MVLEVVNGLAVRPQGACREVNPRAEGPALPDGDRVVINSADIVAYPTPLSHYAVWPRRSALVSRRA